MFILFHLCPLALSPSLLLFLTFFPIYSPQQIWVDIRGRCGEAKQKGNRGKRVGDWVFMDI